LRKSDLSPGSERSDFGTVFRKFYGAPASGASHITESSDMSEPVEQRLEKVESVLAHLQHDFDALNTSLLNQLRRLQEFEARFTRIEHELITFSESPEKRDPAGERPPHY
jgi:uncharacterized coiled-coil protein SlyX